MMKHTEVGLRLIRPGKEWMSDCIHFGGQANVRVTVGHLLSRKKSLQTMSSKQLIMDRLKHGQCIHCGIQTHKIVTKVFAANEKIPMSIQGKVDHGCCLNAKCLEAGNSVTLDPSETINNKPSRINCQTAGAIAVGTGAVFTAMGIPGGDVLSAGGAAFSGIVVLQKQFSPQYRQALPQQRNQQTQKNMNMQVNQRYMEKMENMEHVDQVFAAAPNVGTCPQDDDLQTCPAKHYAPFMRNAIWPNFSCDSCMQNVPIGSYVYYCSTCDWGTCAACDCRHE